MLLSERMGDDQQTRPKVGPCSGLLLCAGPMRQRDTAALGKSEPQTSIMRACLIISK